MADTTSRRRRGAALDPDGRTRMADRPREWKPAADVLETATHYIIRLNLPGLAREQITVVMPDERTLVVRGVYGQDSQAEDGVYLLAERPQVPVEKIFRLPHPVQMDEIAAVLDLGVLSVRMPKRGGAELGPRHIPVS